PDHRSASRPDPPSFPTRRSSDLKSPPSVCTVVAFSQPLTLPLPVKTGRGGVTVGANPLPTEPAGSPACASRGKSACRPLARPGRSEEHTSELQSRENLVCRLLLE